MKFTLSVKSRIFVSRKFFNNLYSTCIRSKKPIFAIDVINTAPPQVLGS